ncbi:MAG: glycosyltransferase family 2 protein [Candidatus Bathyarchaeia archaeon]|jgi:GT2 family glycosyltransferase
MKSFVLSKADGSIPIVSLIVVFKNFENNDIQSLIESTKKVSVKYEIILIVDQASNEAVQKLLFAMFYNKPNLTCLRTIIMAHKSSVTSGRNMGAALAKGSILFFADDDSVVLDDIAPLVNRIQKGECDGIQPLILKLANSDVIDSAGDFIRHNQGLYGAYCKGAGELVNDLSSDLHLEEVPSLRGAFMLVKKDAFFAIGGMDDSLLFNFEDVDLGWRMVCAGDTLLFDPAVKELHKGGSTTEQSDLVNEEVYSLGLVNSFIINLKIVKMSVWFNVLFQFEKKLILYEFSKIKNHHSSFFILILDILKLNNFFLKRGLHAIVDRRVLHEYKFRGSRKLYDMAHGKRFIISD